MAEKVFLTKKNNETVDLQTVAIHDIGIDYIRFTNGVQICWGYKTFNADEIDYDQNISDAMITYPKGFVDRPTIILGRQCGNRKGVNTNDAGLYAGYIYTDDFIVCGSCNVDGENKACCSYVAFGRWK